jgi:protein-tyrosine phosphatase
VEVDKRLRGGERLRVVREIRTSVDHPIRVDFLDAQPWSGRLGITFAPGKKNDSYNWYTWDRDIGMDLERMSVEYGVEVVASILELDEMEMLGIPELRDEVERRGMESLWFPIEDLGVPPGEAFGEFMEFLGAMLARLEAGRCVAVHCRGGLGRSGMVAACLLALRGERPVDAIRAVRRARGQGAVEMPKQEELVEDVASVGL